VEDLHSEEGVGFVEALVHEWGMDEGLPTHILRPWGCGQLCLTLLPLVLLESRGLGQ